MRLTLPVLFALSLAGCGARHVGAPPRDPAPAEQDTRYWSHCEKTIDAKTGEEYQHFDCVRMADGKRFDVWLRPATN